MIKKRIPGIIALALSTGILVGYLAITSALQKLMVDVLTLLTLY